jgi:phosphoribosylglycinamide formyltransferase-1
MSNPLRVVVLASGSGTTFENLVEQSRDGRLHGVQIVALGLSASGLGAALRAERLDVPSTVLNPGDQWRSPARASECIRNYLTENAADLCVMAGWLKLWSIPKEWERRVMNIHPSLLPAFGGKGMYGGRVHAAVLASGAKVSGCTVHFADDTYDGGHIIVQRQVPVLPDDTVELLATRVMEAERRAYPEAIGLFRDKRIFL